MNLPPELLWFIAGLVLILLEFAAPGVIIVFFGAGAWITALTTWIGLTPNLTWQLLVWAVVSVVLLLALRRRLAGRFRGFETGQQDPQQNLDEFRGHEVEVVRDVAPGHRDGRVEFKGAEWSAVSDTPIAAGRIAVITAADGLTLHVRPTTAGSETVADGDASEGE